MSKTSSFVADSSQNGSSGVAASSATTSPEPSPVSTPKVKDRDSSTSSSCSHESEKHELVALYNREEDATEVTAVHTCTACGNQRAENFGCLL